jgi:acetylornithine deacetylase/succinyl-diaminopimelate desuccinylase-like protein
MPSDRATVRSVVLAAREAGGLAGVCPLGMLFGPCRGGVSHRPDEYTTAEDMAHGVRVLARTLQRLAG